MSSTLQELYPRFAPFIRFDICSPFSKGTSIQGAIAYRDSNHPTQFRYFPTTSEVNLGQRLRAFRVYHFGIGPVFCVQTASGEPVSAAGALIAGTFAYDLSQQARSDLKAAIAREFNVVDPKLLPVPLRHPSITSVLVDKQFGQFGDVQQNLPANFQIGPEAAFSVGSKESLFALVLANVQSGASTEPNPAFSINVNADVEFVGDPWTYDVDCDFAQVWHKVRKRAAATVSLGWIL